MSALGRRYWLVWSAAIQSNLADGIFLIALPLLAARYTDSPALIAGVALAGRLPWLLFALHAGALVDRIDRRSTMRNVNLVRSVTLGVLGVAVFTGAVTLPLLFAVAFVLGVAETLFDTSAQSLVPRLVAPDQLQRANGRLYAGEVTANGFAGPSLGGLLAGLSVAVAFAVSGLAYAGAAAALSLVKGRFRPYRERRTGLHRDIREGLSYLAGHRVLRTLAVVGGLTNMAWFAWQSVLVLYAVDPGPMGLSEFGYGLLLTAGAAGSVLGSFFVDRMTRLFGRARLLQLCLVGWAVWLGGPALSTNPWLVGALVVVGSAAGMWWNIISVSYRQRVVPDAMLGRVNAAYRLFAWGAMPVGAALGGLLGELFGLRALFSVTALGTLVLVVPLRLIVTERSLQN
ncbi:MFS transporter [Natronosporangium hydrolyticum]|uniref:MFS transporter n=1 Tax=Natronosporangium hydrolyticum TaxID=2811111 RepID=A0A895Y7W6_9ACTN|nr:MFS transporter [Natronosporangium hydrolyticum]QSB13441.1 MFS transporter [Natronosporangium hydrolyticum]